MLRTRWSRQPGTLPFSHRRPMALRPNLAIGLPFTNLLYANYYLLNVHTPPFLNENIILVIQIIGITIENFNT